MRLATRSVRRPGRARNAGEKYLQDVKMAAFVATDRASRGAQGAVQRRMRAAGLGRLSNAVGQTSALKKRQYDRNPYGVLFARGGDESLAGGALDAYSRGVTIRTKERKWLAFATKAIPQRVGRRKITPALYEAGGFGARYGHLEFRPVNPRLALLVIRDTSITAKGRIRERGKRLGRGSTAQKEVVAFVLIRFTRRAQRFDKLAEVRPYGASVPQLIQEELKRRRRG